MADTHLTLQCEDVAAGASFFRNVLALPVHPRDDQVVDVELGGVVATLTPRLPADPAPAHPDAPPTIETGSTARRATAASDPSLVVEVEVHDVREAARELQRRGADILVWPVLTDWGTESAFVAGPDGVVVELFRRHDA